MNPFTRIADKADSMALSVIGAGCNYPQEEVLRLVSELARAAAEALP